jgi:hypothetical protein
MNEASTPMSGFAAFLPPEYRGEFSREWLMGLSPFSDNTCMSCYSVRQGQWVSFGRRSAEGRLLKCERAVKGTKRDSKRGGYYGEDQQSVAE